MEKNEDFVMTKLDRRNKYCFGLGTIGRDMFYSMESMFLLVFLTEVKNLDDKMLALVGGVLTVLRILDAFNDPITGVIIDNTHTRWGKFKPWMVIGALVSSVCMLVMFADLPLGGGAYVIVFAVSYILWDIFYGVNDIAYWAQLPALILGWALVPQSGSALVLMLASELQPVSALWWALAPVLLSAPVFGSALALPSALVLR